MLDTECRLAAIRAELVPLQQQDGEVTVTAGCDYGLGDPVRIRVRRRGRRYDLADDGAALSRAHKPAGWLGPVERVVAAEGFNVNRAGAIFVPAVEGRDIASLVLRLAETSRTAYLTLIELADT